MSVCEHDNSKTIRATGMKFGVIHKRAAFYLANDTMCIVDGDVYRNGDPVPTDDECERCTCRPPGFSCVLRDCDTKPGCKAVRRAGECCPEYVCGCVHNNRVYEDGEIIKDLQNNCYTCRCHGSSISCTFAECLFRGDCPPEYVPGECCPRYDHCPPLSTTSSSTIFTTESTTQSEIVQQQKVFLNLTTQHLEKFTDEGTTLTIVDILPSSTTTTTTQAYSEETSTTTMVTVKFTLTDGAVTSISDLNLNTLTTLLPLQTSTYSETTKYIIPDENQLKLTTTQASTSDVSDGDSSSKEILFSTETAQSEKEELFTSTTSILTESTKVTTPTPDTLLEEGTSEKIPQVHSSDENTSETTKNDSVALEDSTDMGLHFDETGDHSKTPTDDVIIDSSTTSYETTQVFDGEETDSEEESDSTNTPSETSDDSLVHSSTIDKDDKLVTENPEKTHGSSTTADFSSATEIVKEEISLLPESLHNVSSDGNATEFVTIASYTEESIEHEYEPTKASTVEGTHEPSSEFTEMLDGEEKFSTDKLDKLSVATDSPGASFETSSTEKSRETTLAIESTTIQSFNQTTEVQDTTTEHISVNSQDEEKYFSTEQTKENEEILFTAITRPATELSSEMDESFVALENKSHEIPSTLQQFDTTSSVERDVTEDGKKTTQHTDSIESQTSSLEDKQSTSAPSEYSTDPEISVELKNFTESPLFSSETSAESVDFPTEMESETKEKHEIYSSTVVSTTKTTEQPLISDTPHISEIEFSETIHNDSSDNALEESNTNEHTSSDSYLLTILDSETTSSTDDTNISDLSDESDTTVKEQQNTSSISVEDHTSVETSSVEPKFGVFTTNNESTTQENTSDISSNVIPETTSESALDGNMFVTETTKTNTSIHENISELSIIDLSENSETETSKEILESTTSAIIENNESTELSFTENSGSKLELDYNSVSTTDSNQNEGHSVFPKISESTTEDDIIQNAETEATSEGSSGIKESTTTDSLTDTASNVSENEVTTLMDQTEDDVLESETLQSNFDTIVSNQQTTKSGENFDSNESGISKLVSDTTESENISTLKHIASEDNNNTSSSTDNNSALGSTDTEDESGLDVTSSLKENDIGETSQFSTSSTNDINTTSFPLIQDFKTKVDGVTKTIENHSRDSTHLSTDIDVTTTKIPVDANDTSLIANETETEGSDGFNNDLTSTLSKDHENFSSELKTSIVNSPSNDVPALILFDHENNETNFSTTTTSNYSDYAAPDEQTESNKLVTNLETDDLEFPPKLSDNQGTTSVNDEDYSALDSEENFSEETNEHSALDVIRPSETEENKSVSFDETESFSPSGSTFHQTKASTLSADKDLISEEIDPDAKENVSQDGYSDEINTAANLQADSEENSFSSTVHPISNSYSTEEIHSIGEFTHTKSEDAEKFSINVENTENWKLDNTTPEQDSSNTKLTTISLEQTSPNAKNNTFISIDEFEAHPHEVTYKETTLNIENFTNPSFQPAENSSYPQFHDNILLSKSNENETLIVDVDDHTLKFENDEFSSKEKDDISANEAASNDFNEGNSFEETFEGEEALSSENTIVTGENVIHVSDELNLSNQGNGNDNLDQSDLPLLSVISSNDNPSFASTSTSNINNIPEEATTHIEINDGDNYSTSNVQNNGGQNNGEFESSETPANNFATPDASAVTENKENGSNEELSTVDENTFGEAMHEYSDDHEKHDILKFTSTVSQNTQTTNHDQSFDYHGIEMDSEEETTEFLNINITKPSVSYRVETARNLDDSTTSDNLSVENESTSLNVESFTKDEVSNTQSDEEHSNISEIAEISDDTSINSTVKASYLHDDSNIFNEMGDHFSGGNLYSAFVIPSGEKMYEVDKKKDIEHVSSENVSNSNTFPKNAFEAYGYLGGVFITGNSKYNDHKEHLHGISHSLKDEINIVENKNNVEASENPSLILDSEENAEKNNEDISELESEIGKETVIKNETTAYLADHYFDGDTENLASRDQSTQNDLQIASTENINYNISSNTSFLHPNTTSETSEKQNFQISVESSKNGSGPEKGGEWLEPTLPSPNAAVFLQSQSEQINSNENANSVVESDDYSPSVNTSEQNQKAPEKGGELFEPTISNPFHLDQKPGQNEKTDQSSDELAAESHSATEKSSFATDIPLYVLSRGKESNHPGASQHNSAQESGSEGSDMSNIHSNYLRNNNSQIDEENSAKEIPSFPMTILNETLISFNDSQNMFTEPLTETEESNFTSGMNESILMSDENRVNLLQPYSLIDVISNVFKAPGYDSEVHSHFLKEQVNYSDKEEPLVLVKRNADTSQERIVFEKETAVKPDPNSKLYHDKTNPHVLQTKKTIYSPISPASSTNTRPQDPPPAKVTSSFIFVVSPNDDNPGSINPSSSSSGSAEETELPNDNMFSQNNAQKTRN
ncbi:hypothetical protein AVEN_150302-1 [Araneus ventricosus]|uniref:VWFC domain-containing protein n=1 Tax=Araneus ventricosus TaxID=182803 RepID=A0A4Y2PUN6_ARAVE|nr:hypothetical protein AVEN_24604-1 [Araneus ventricosus]GBN54904.1 hypothetical protein AVEN_150302-1 [Araneus ventricosus]